VNLGNKAAIIIPSAYPRDEPFTN